MKRSRMPTFRLLAALLLVPLLSGCSAKESPQPNPNLPVEVFFSPKGGCTEAVVKEIAASKSSILVQAYSFTSAPIAAALRDAHRRGVKVEVILDKSQRTEKYSSADFLSNAGVPTRIDDKHAIAHNKTMILDGEVVITGSFNFTKAAEESNAENLLVIRDKALAERYTANWKEHAAHSDPYEGKEERQEPASKTEPAPPSGKTGFVASKNSQVFHRLDCGSAAKISEKNVIQFGTRDEAVQSGRKPCGECRP